MTTGRNRQFFIKEHCHSHIGGNPPRPICLFEYAFLDQLFSILRTVMQSPLYHLYLKLSLSRSCIVLQNTPMGNSARKQLQKRGKAIHCLSAEGVSLDVPRSEQVFVRNFPSAQDFLGRSKKWGPDGEARQRK